MSGCEAMGLAIVIMCAMVIFIQRQERSDEEKIIKEWNNGPRQAEEKAVAKRLAEEKEQWDKLTPYQKEKIKAQNNIASAIARCEPNRPGSGDPYGHT